MSTFQENISRFATTVFNLVKIQFHTAVPPFCIPRSPPSVHGVTWLDVPAQFLNLHQIADLESRLQSRVPAFEQQNRWHQHQELHCNCLLEIMVFFGVCAHI